MTAQVIVIVFSALMALVNAIFMAKYNQKCKQNDEREKLLQIMQNDISMLKRGYLTEDRMRIVFKEELAHFELRLINEGRLEPKARRHP